MTKKKPEAESNFCQAGQRPSAEKRTEAFYTELQQAIDDVDWGSVVVPKLSDCPMRKSKLSSCQAFNGLRLPIPPKTPVLRSYRIK